MSGLRKPQRPYISSRRMPPMAAATAAMKALSNMPTPRKNAAWVAMWAVRSRTAGATAGGGWADGGRRRVVGGRAADEHGKDHAGDRRDGPDQQAVGGVAEVHL